MNKLIGNIFIEHKIEDHNYKMPTSDIHDYYSVSLIVSGDRKIITPDGIYFVHSHNVSFMNKDLYHRSSSISDTPYERLGVKFTYCMIERLIPFIGLQCFEELVSNIVYPISEEGYSMVYDLLMKMLFESEHPHKWSELILEGLLHQLIVTIITHKLPCPSVKLVRGHDKKIMAAIDYINDHLSCNPSCTEVAAHVGLSYSQFSLRFKKAIGSSYSYYLNHIKIKYAETLLLSTDESIEDISAHLNYCNSNYFCTVFKKYNHLSPTAYRKCMKRQ